MTASLSIRQVIEAGPKMPSTDPAARARTESRAASRSLLETKCAPFEANGDRFIPRVCAVYRNSASQILPNIVALRDFFPLGKRQLGVSSYHTWAKTSQVSAGPSVQLRTTQTTTMSNAIRILQRVSSARRER